MRLFGHGRRRFKQEPPVEQTLESLPALPGGCASSGRNEQEGFEPPPLCVGSQPASLIRYPTVARCFLTKNTGEKKPA